MDVVFTYGRFNPPHLGHKMMIEEVINKASKMNKIPVVVVSHSYGNKSNPLSVEDKTRILKRWFPQLTVLSSSKNLSLAKIAENFDEKSVMVVGENRKNAFSLKVELSLRNKGQLISKGLFFFQFSKKTNKKFLLD